MSSKNPLYDFIPNTDILDRKIYVTSDLHYAHKNMVYGVSNWPDKEKACRKFNTVAEMNDVLVKSVNDYVQKDDVFIHLGDWNFGGGKQGYELRNKIQCQHVINLYGNHDRHMRVDKVLQSMFHYVGDYLELVYKGVFFNFFHYPIASWNNMGKNTIHVHGHCHQNLQEKLPRRIDVGWDGYHRPLTLDEIIQIVGDEPAKLVDHHSHRTTNH